MNSAQFEIKAGSISALERLEDGQPVWLRYDCTDSTTLVRVMKTGRDSYRMAGTRQFLGSDLSLTETIDLISRTPKIRDFQVIELKEDDEIHL